MDLREYLRIVRRRWRIVVAGLLIGIIGMAAFLLTATKQYQARTEAFVSLRQPDADSLAAYQGGLFSQARVQSYVEVVTSPAVTEPVVRKLKLAITPDELAAKITALAPPNTVIIQIVVQDSSPRLARDIAAAVGAQFSTTVSSLEATSAATTSPVKVTLVRQPSIPTVPVSPRVPFIVAVSIALGLAAGLGGAVLREALDSSVKTSLDLEKLTGKPTLAQVHFDPDAADRPAITSAEDRTPRAEEFRTLRTNLKFVDIDNPPKIVLITSSVAEEGKSSTACNLAVTLAFSGSRVALVEGDLRRPRVADYMGIEGAVGLTDVLLGQAELQDVIQRWGSWPLTVLPSGTLPPNPSELLGTEHAAALLRRLAEDVDVVIVDAPPLLPVTDAAVLAAACDGAIVVVRHGRTTTDQVEKAILTLRNVGARVLGTVLSMSPRRGPDADRYTGRHYYETESRLLDVLTPEPEQAPIERTRKRATTGA